MAPSNHLANETSPYLLQHAQNPVDWYPWGEAALAKARRDNKPILLSIGYSACHWCHVMAHESFEDEDVARVMNEHYVCIKVDREERPDLDKVYQTAHQYLAQRAGGWPLTVFLTPHDLMPFFAGTYFPKAPRYGMPGFADVLQRVAAAYREQRDAIAEQNEALRGLFARLDAADPSDASEPNAQVLEQARDELRAQFDEAHGGFGGAPKFPHPTSLEFLLRYAARAGNAERRGEALEMVRVSLRRMALGGLYDQIGGGFFRYSVDAHWEIPHFEKMLYDNAQLLPLYADAFRATDDPLFQRVAEESGEWVMREMQAPSGGYYSTLDADSEGDEGKFYVWSGDEIQTLLAPEQYAVVEQRFGLDGTPNFEGRWHLNVRADAEGIAAKLRLSETEVRARLDAARAKLFRVRERRVRPARDEKILASWNGLMIRGMARAGRLLARADFIASAARALDFARRKFWYNGRLFAMAKDNRANLNAYLDDYVFLIAGAFELLQARWHRADFDFAVALTQVVIDQFEDKPRGGFYFTSHDHEPLVHRPKPITDEALPAGNGMAAQVLLRLGHLLGDLDWLRAAESTIRSNYPRVAHYPSAYGALLIALEEYLEPPACVVIRGTPQACTDWQCRLLGGFHPTTAILAIPSSVDSLPGILAERKPLDRTAAYVCTGHTCRPPVFDTESLAVLLQQR
jgi:uncharacterized protein YyaL (SSP411 family)